MTAPMTLTRPTASLLDDHTVQALRASLFEDLDAQHMQILELQRTVDDLMGQQDTDSLLEREIAERAIGRAIEAAADIEHALRRIDDGTYGSCEQCGAPVGAARLEVIPHARLCVDCTPGAPRPVI